MEELEDEAVLEVEVGWEEGLRRGAARLRARLRGEVLLLQVHALAQPCQQTRGKNVGPTGREAARDGDAGMGSMTVPAALPT